MYLDHRGDALYYEFKYKFCCKFLCDANKCTIQIGIAMFTCQGGLIKMPAIRMASAVVSLVPMMIVYLFLQRFIVESIAMSGIKQ